ncbi:hypothetical protein LTR85_008361 [Meristemomyces frigidus]|nr:hypothetical protein LTR85_008361 [Meristemomyces frigidus]
MEGRAQKLADLQRGIEVLKAKLEKREAEQASLAAGKGGTRPSQTSDAVRSVFHTTELLEAILDHTDLRDLFVLRGVSKAFNNTVAGSVILRRRMFLVPTTLPHLDLLPSFVLPGLLIILDRVDNNSWSKDLRVIIRYDARAQRVRLGPQVRSTQLSRHPIQWLRAYPCCCWKGQRNGEDVWAPKGITLGSLYDKALRIAEEHEACPNRFDELKAGLASDPHNARPLWAAEFTSEWHVLPETHPFRVKEITDQALAQPLRQRLVETSMPWLHMWELFRAAKLQGTLCSYIGNCE